MDNRGIALKQIHSYLAEWTQHIYQQNASGKFDINKDSENLSIKILNSVYGYDLKNANSLLSDNFPAIDLVDDKNGIVVQVTSDSSSEKIIETVKKYISKDIYKSHPKLHIYLLTNKGTYYAPTKDKLKDLTKGKVNFNIKDNILDNSTIGKAINSFTEISEIKKIEAILESEFGKTHKQNPLFKSIKTDQKRFKFNFNNRLTSFLGREKELAQLENFFSSEPMFSWWLLTGKAGSGKSRLALEIGYKLDPLGVEWGFLPANEILSFEWRQHFSKPFLIIIDYVQYSYRDVLVLIKNLSNRSDLKFPIRILLIERENNGVWWDEFTSDYIASSTVHNAEPLELSTLNNDSLFNIIKNIIDIEHKSVSLDKERVVEALEKLDNLKRPLFAMFVGLALAREANISHWNQDNLLHFVIEDHLKLTKKIFAEYQENYIYKHINLVAVATVCYGITNFNIKLIFEKKLSWLPYTDEFDSELYNYISYASKIERKEDWEQVFYSNKSDNELQLHPLQPDILGEYFVLNSLENDNRFKFRDQNRVKEFIELVESIGFYYYQDFVRRLLQDFPTHNKIKLFLIGNQTSYINNLGMSCRLILDAMKYMYTKNTVLLDTMLGYVKLLAITTNNNSEQKGYMDDPKRAYQEACQIMVYHYNGDFNKQYEYYKIIKENTDFFEKNPHDIIDGTPIFDDSTINFENIREEFEKIKDPEYAKKYLQKLTVVDARIPHLEALSIDCILRTNKVLPNNIIDILTDRLFSLCEKFTDPRIKVVTLESCIEFGTDKIKDFDQISQKLLLNILKTPRQVAPINVEYQQLLFSKNLIDYKIYKRDSYGALEAFDKLYNHLTSIKSNFRIGQVLVELAQFSLNICKAYYEKGIMITGDLFKERISLIYKLFIGAPYNPVDEIIKKAERFRNGSFG